VSHLFPAYIVKTEEPWRLARIAVGAEFKDRSWALENAQIDGEADFTICAMISEGPNGETEFGSAYHLTEVFPLEEAEVERLRGRTLVYDSIADCFHADDLEASPTQAGEDFTAEELAARAVPLVSPKLEIYTAQAPAYWASYLINGDASGIEPAEKEAADRWIARQNMGSPVSCSDESWFSSWHDALPESPLAGDVLEYVFLVREPAAQS
jgi:hypothetical protein